MVRYTIHNVKHYECVSASSSSLPFFYLTPLDGHVRIVSSAVMGLVRTSGDRVSNWSGEQRNERDTSGLPAHLLVV